MSNLIKFLIIAVALSLFLGPAIITAQNATEAINLDENVQPQDLGIGEPKILPDSPFYFLKNWARDIQSFFTFDPVKKAELNLKFSNEKLMEVKKTIEKTEDPEIIKKATENYQQEVERVKEQVEKIKQKAKENPKVDSFLNKFIQQQTLHQKLLQKLETQVPPQALEKIKEARDAHLEKFQGAMLKLEDRPEKITEKLDKILEEQKGSQFKNFKNLEILRNLEEKVPEQAKEAIQKAQENALKRLQGDLEKMSPEDQERFREYIENISGEKEKHFEIMESFKLGIPETPGTRELKEKLEKEKIKMLEKIKKISEKPDCPAWVTPEPGFCSDGRIVIEKDSRGCVSPPRCIIPGEEKGGCFCKTPCSSSVIPEMIDCQYFDEPPTTHSYRCPELCNKKFPIQPRACITLWNPVCGKDEKTYSNECFAKLAEMEIVHKGICRKEIKYFDKRFCPDYGDCADVGLEARKCTNLDDCVTSCAFGCISRKWIEGRVDCEALWPNFQCECIAGICQRKFPPPSIPKIPEKPEVCIQVITPAISPEGTCKEFPTPCDVPAGWKEVEGCPSPVLSACRNLCGDGICQEVVCMAIGCPCSESSTSCPEDCKK